MKAIKENKNIEINSVKDVTPKTKKKFKISIPIVYVMILIIVMSSIIGYMCSEIGANYWETKVDNIVLEYGESFHANLEDLVDTKKYPRVTEQNTTLTYNFPDERPLPIGKYDVYIVHTITFHLFGMEISPDDEVKTISVIIQDTIAPEVEAPAEIEILKGIDIKNYDFQKYIKTSDTSEIKNIKINTESIDTSKVGDYLLNVVVTDAENNETTIEIKVKVIEVPETKEVGETKVVDQEDGTTKVVIDLKDKPEPTTTTTTQPTTTQSHQHRITTSATTTTRPATTQSAATTQPTTTQKPSTTTQPTTTQSSATQQTKPQNQTNKNEPCKHDSTGNIGGWYKTWDEAEEAITVYIIKSGKAGYAHYTPIKCNKCGLWSGYVTFDK